MLMIVWDKAITVCNKADINQSSSQNCIVFLSAIVFLPLSLYHVRLHLFIYSIYVNWFDSIARRHLQWLWNPWWVGLWVFAMCVCVFRYASQKGTLMFAGRLQKGLFHDSSTSWGFLHKQPSSHSAAVAAMKLAFVRADSRPWHKTDSAEAGATTCRTVACTALNSAGTQAKF